MSKSTVFRSIAYLLVITCLLASSSGALASQIVSQADRQITAVDPDPLVQVMLSQVTQDQVMFYDRQMAGEEPVWVDGDWYTIPTRYTYSGTPMQKTTDWVGQHMSNDLGLDVEYHVWDDDTNPNVIGEIPGLTNPDEIYIIGAHIDDVQGAPGADDNASGSVATLIAADILSQFEWGCTLRFAFWTGEEQGLIGSSYYANRSAGLGENIVGYLNLDMIAWNTIGSNPDIDLIYASTVPGSQAFAQLFADAVAAYNLDLQPQLIQSLSGGSDHMSFWDAGYNSILAIEDQNDFNPYYHSPQDTPAHTDPAYFTDFTKASLATFVHFNNCLIASGLGAIDGTVIDASNSDPIEGVDISFEDSSGRLFHTGTDATGYYTDTLLADVYTVSASIYGYLPEIVTGVPVYTDTVTTVDLALEPADSYNVSGYVREVNSGVPLDATVQFADAPVAPVQTDPATGFYSIEVAEGTWTMQVQADGYAPASVDVEVFGGDVEQDFNLYPYCDLFSDDIEDGNTVWTAESPWAITELQSHSPTHAWTDSPSGTYGNNIDVTLTSAPWDLSEYSGMSLNFWHRYATESGYDYASVEYSVDGGVTWNQVMNWDGTQTSWTEVELALPQLDGQANAQLRFRLTSDVSVQGDGWYVDDIVLTGGGPVCAPPAAPTADFSSNSPVFLGQGVEFENETIGTEPISYTWDFGDGSGTSVEENPVYTYGEIGAYTVTLTATNDLGTSVAEGVVEVLAAPDITVEPGAITMTLGMSSTGSAELELGNVGDGELEITGVTADAPWLTVPVTLPVTIEPDGSLALTVDFDTSGLISGTYSAELTILSNDPDEGEVIVPVTLVVTESAVTWELYLPVIAVDAVTP